MNSNKYLIKSDGTGMSEALAFTERIGNEAKLTSKENLRLRLLAEELLGMLRSVAGNVEANYIVGRADKSFTLTLASEIKMTQELKKQLISISSKGKNAAAKGFMGRIKDVIATVLLPDESGISPMSSFSLGLMSAAPNVNPSAQQSTAESFIWSMNQYKSKIDDDRGYNSESKYDWDELEKSIVASIADDVIVKISGCNVEISISKSF